MRLKQLAAVLALLACACDLRAQEVGQYQNATTPLTGAERLLADQAGTTVNITPTMLENYVFPTGVLGVPLGGTGVSTLTGLIIGNGTAPFSAANAANVYSLFGCSGASQYLNGAGGCTTPSGAGTVTTTGTPVTNTLAAFSGATSITNAVVGDITGLFTGTCSSSTFLRGDGSCQTVSGSGTVTSIGLTVPPWEAVTPASITTSGTFAITSASGLAANQFLATSAGTVGLRSIVLGDLPLIPLNTGTSGTLNVANGGTGAVSLTGLVLGNGVSPFSAATSANVYSLWTGTCNSTTYLRGDGVCAAAGSGSGTISSIGLTMPAWFTVTNSPLVANGTIAVTQTSPVPSANGGTGVNNAGAITAPYNITYSGTGPLAFVGQGSATITYPSGTVTLCPSDKANVAKTASYTLVAGDVCNDFTFNLSAGATLTIPANASVPFNSGQSFDIFNSCSSSANLTISITSDTLHWMPTNSTTSRTLAPCGEATIYKQDSTDHVISGVGIT